MARVYIKGKTKANIKKKPNTILKAGQSMPRNIGGAINAKLVATVKKQRNG